jgi:hypothetical protein
LVGRVKSDNNLFVMPKQDLESELPELLAATILAKLEKLDRLDERFDRLDERFDRTDKKIDRVDTKLVHAEERLAAVEGKTASMDATLVVQAGQLTEHIRRTALLEDRTEVLIGRQSKLESKFAKAKYIVGGLVGGVVLMSGIAKIPELIKLLLSLMG